MDIAGKDAANPLAILLSSVQMLRYLKLPSFADRVERSIFATLDSGVKTRDIGGTASTSEFTAAICARLHAESHKNKSSKASKGVSKAV